MTQVIRKFDWRGSSDPAPAELVDRELIVTNGLGGYASGTLAGVITRGFHRYLVAALPTPLGRIMMFNDLVETVQLTEGNSLQLSGEERVNAPIRAHGASHLREFRLEDGLPVWTDEIGEVLLEKKVLMVHRQNTVHIHNGSGSTVFGARLRGTSLECSGNSAMLRKAERGSRPALCGKSSSVVTEFRV